MQSNTRDDLAVIRSFCSHQPPPLDDVSSFLQDDVTGMASSSDHHQPLSPTTSPRRRGNNNDSHGSASGVSRSSDHSDNNSNIAQRRRQQQQQQHQQKSFDYLRDVIVRTDGGNNNSATTMDGSRGDNGDENNDRSAETTFRLDLSADTAVDASLPLLLRGEGEKQQQQQQQQSIVDGQGRRSEGGSGGERCPPDGPGDPTAADLFLKACDTATSACGGGGGEASPGGDMQQEEDGGNYEEAASPATPALAWRRGGGPHYNDDGATATTTPASGGVPNTPWTEARSFVDGLLSPFSPLLKQQQQPNGGGTAGDVDDDNNAGKNADPQERLRSEYLQYVSLIPCRKVSVVVRVLPIPDDGGDDAAAAASSQQRCVFPHYREERPAAAANNDAFTTPASGSRRFASPPPSGAEAGGQRTPAQRDVVVVNPTAFGRYIPSQVTMETARLVAQVAQINTEDWARLYEYHHVMWPPGDGDAGDGRPQRGIGGGARSFDTMDSLSRAAAQDALVEHRSSLLISLGREASCIGNQERGLWPKILTHCQAVAEAQAVITLSMVEVLEDRPDSFRDLLLPHQQGGGGGGGNARRPITLRHNDMKGAVLEGLVEVSIDSMPALLESLYRRRRRKSSKAASGTNGGGGGATTTTAVIGILNLWKDAVSHELRRPPTAQITCVELATSSLTAGPGGSNISSVTERADTIVQRKSTVSLGQALRQLLLQNAAVASRGAGGGMASGTPGSAARDADAVAAAMLLPATGYRESTLTKVLQRSMESSKIVVVGTISPLSRDHDQTVATLNYLRRLLVQPGTTASSPFRTSNGIGGGGGASYAASIAMGSSTPAGTAATRGGTNAAAPPPPAPSTTRCVTSPEENEKLHELARSRGMLETLVADPRQRLAKLLKTSPSRTPHGPSREFRRSPEEEEEEEEDVEPINYMHGMHGMGGMDIGETTSSMSWEKHYPQPHAQDPSYDEDDGADTGNRPEGSALESRGDTTPQLVESPGAGQGRHLWHQDEEEEDGADDTDINSGYHQPGRDVGWYSEEEIERALENEIQGVGRLYPEENFSDEGDHEVVDDNDFFQGNGAGKGVPMERSVANQANEEQWDADNDDFDKDVVTNQINEELWSLDLEPPEVHSADADDGHLETLETVRDDEYQEQPNSPYHDAVVDDGGEAEQAEECFTEELVKRSDSSFSRVINDHLEEDFHDDYQGYQAAQEFGQHTKARQDGESWQEYDRLASIPISNRSSPEQYDGEEAEDLHVIEFFGQDEDHSDQGSFNGEYMSVTELDPIDSEYGIGNSVAASDLPDQSPLLMEQDDNLIDTESVPTHASDDDLSLNLGCTSEERRFGAEQSHVATKEQHVSGEQSQPSRKTSFVDLNPEDEERSGDNEEPQTDYELPEAPIQMNESMESSRWHSDASPPVILDEGRLQAGVRLPSPLRERSAFTSFPSPYSSRHNATKIKELSVLAAEREELHSTVEMLKENLRKVSEDHDDHLQQYEEEAQQLYAKLDAALDDKRAVERIANEAINAQTSQLEEMRLLAAEREELRLTVETLKENLTKASNNQGEQLQRYKKEVDQLHSKLGKTVKIQRSLEKIADEAVSAHTTQVEETRQLAAERDELYSTVKSLQERVNFLSADHDTHVKRYQNEIRQLRFKLEEMVEERRSVQTTADDARFACEAQSEKIRFLSSERDELRLMVDSMKASIRKISGDHNDHLLRYKKEVQQLHLKLDEALNEKLAIEKVADEVRFTNSDLERKVKNLEDESIAGRLRADNIDDLRLKSEQKLIDVEKASLKLKESLDELERERDVLRKQKRDDEANLKRLETELKRQKNATEHAESSNARLEHLRQEDQETIRKMSEEIRSKDSERFGLEHLQHELTRLKRDKDYLQSLVENRKAEHLEVLQEREEEIAEYKQKYSEVQKEFEGSLVSLASANRTKEACESQLKLSQENVSKLTRQVVAKDESIERLESSLVRLQALRREDHNTIRLLNSEIRNKESDNLDVQHLQNELSRNKRDKDHLETLLAHKSAEYTEALQCRDEEIVEFKSKLEELEEVLLASRVDLTSAEQQKSDCLNQIQSLEENLSKLTQQVRARDESIDRLKANLIEVESLRNEDHEAIRDLTGELRKKETEQLALDQVHHKLSRLKQDKEHLECLMETRKVEYETLLKERANEVTDCKKQVDTLQLLLEKMRSDEAKQRSDAVTQLNALREVETQLVMDLEDRDRTIESLRLDYFTSKEEMTIVCQREKSHGARADREIDILQQQVARLEAELVSTKRDAEEASSQVQYKTRSHKAALAELERAKEEVRRQKVALDRLNEELDSRQQESLRGKEKVYQMEATLRRFQEETKEKVGQMMGRHKESTGVLETTLNEKQYLTTEMRHLETMVDKLRAERDECLKSLQIGRQKMAELASKKNIHGMEGFFDLSPRQGSRSSEFFPPPTTTASRRSAAAPEIYITDYSIDRALSVRAEEIAACVAMSARNSIEESQGEASHLRSQVHRLAEEKSSEAIALKAKIRRLEEELSRRVTETPYHNIVGDRRRNRYSFQMDPAE